MCWIEKRKGEGRRERWREGQKIGKGRIKGPIEKV